MISTKAVLVSMGALSAAMALGVTAPAMTAFPCAELPRVYGALLVWLTPPYLYLVINGIIISIAASSRFQKTDAQVEWASEAVSTPTPGVEAQPEEYPTPPVVLGGFDTADQGGGAEGEITVTAKNTAALQEDGGQAAAEEFVVSRSSWTPEMGVPLPAEKPLVSVRFGGRKGVKASPEGRVLRVAKSGRYETLESTWKTITDGRAMPLPRHLRKSETWGSGGDGGCARAREETAASSSLPPPALPPSMRKLEETAFSERRVGSASPSSPGGYSSSSKGRLLRREASPGQDELNRRVEAFIKKFNGIIIIMTTFLCAELPRVYGALLVWLTPPYLYLVINGIIISIAASSRFQKTDGEVEWASEAAVSTATPALEAQPEEYPTPPVVFSQIGGGGPEEEDEGSGRGGGFDTAEGGGAVQGEIMVTAKNTAALQEDGGQEAAEFVVSRSSWTPEMRSVPLPEEKPLVSVRFGGRKGVKASPEGSWRVLRVAKSRRYETLESTWKTITDGRAMPLPRHLRKSETWGSTGGDGGCARAREETAATSSLPPPLPPSMRKLEKTTAFNERQVGSASPSAPGGGYSSSNSKGRLLRREASPGQDELNRRVEAFIKKFNEEMRLQRHESCEKNYMDMVVT